MELKLKNIMLRYEFEKPLTYLIISFLRHFCYVDCNVSSIRLFDSLLVHFLSYLLAGIISQPYHFVRGKIFFHGSISTVMSSFSLIAHGGQKYCD